MSNEGTEAPAPAAAPGVGVCARAIDKARQVGGRALERLRGLAGDLPDGAVEQVERLHRDPLSERRRAARLSVGADLLTVGAHGLIGGSVRDHCPTGLSMLMPSPMEVGAVLRVLLPTRLGGGWVTVEVRHCRQEASGWVVGCELVRGQPPI